MIRILDIGHKEEEGNIIKIVKFEERSKQSLKSGGGKVDYVPGRKVF